MDINQSWKSFDFIGFDTETTGAYPLCDEICELAAVKWRGGQIIETFQTLLKPSRPMGDFIIGIHGITNEMVSHAPLISEKIHEFHRFIEGGILVAHHAPFDLGFLAVEFEKTGLSLPSEPVLCSSLLARKIFPESENHKLQTLIPFLGLKQGQAHRAFDDAQACLDVSLKCMERLEQSAPVSLSQVFEHMGGPLHWSRFSLKEFKTHAIYGAVVTGIYQKSWLEIAYGKPQKELGNRIKMRKIRPIGIVRNPDGDFVMAFCPEEKRNKRFYLEKFSSAQLCEPML